MYTGFNLSLDNEDFFSDDNYYEKGKEKYSTIKRCALSNLKQIIGNKIINGDALQNLWFPNEFFRDKSFVFISHSHADEELAIKLAGYLYEKFGIYSFIDSCVWMHSDDLNKELNNCSLKEYNRCNSCGCEEFSYNISCVHMMLASALTAMIDKCECIFFLNTPSSLNINRKTESPWIYYELNIANVIQKISRINVPTMESAKYMLHSIEFTPKLDDMIDIDAGVLLKWENMFNPFTDNPYAVLYKICGGIKRNGTS